MIIDGVSPRPTTQNFRGVAQEERPKFFGSWPEVDRVFSERFAENDEKFFRVLRRDPAPNSEIFFEGVISKASKKFSISSGFDSKKCSRNFSLFACFVLASFQKNREHFLALRSRFVLEKREEFKNPEHLFERFRSRKVSSS